MIYLSTKLSTVTPLLTKGDGVEIDPDIKASQVLAPFRHAAGALGSHFFTVLREEGRLLGWRSGNPPRVTVPPVDQALPGEWVEVGTEAVLEAYAPNEWLAALGRDAEAESCLALVRLRAADNAMLSRLRNRGQMLAIGQTLAAHFAEERTGSILDFWFEPSKS